VRLREVSLVYQLSNSLASLVKASGASVVVTGRNLGIWTDFTSWDPENNTSGTDGPNYNFVQLAQPRVFLLRVNLNY